MGCTVKNIFVQSLIKQKNWMYVVLSRVRTRKGLYLREPLDHKNLETFNRIDMDLKAMLNDFKDTIFFEHFSEQEYQEILGHETYVQLPAIRCRF